MTVHVDVLDIMSKLRAAEESFAVATVVRTVSVTAAKAGAKGVIRPDGTIVAGWIGGGCARAAVLRAARQALADGQPRLVSIQPEDLLTHQGLKGGEERDGATFFVNGCPSQGTMDIFIEPVLPKPALVILGASPVALALAALGRQFGYHVDLAVPRADLTSVPDADRVTDGFSLPGLEQGKRYIVVSTQGRGDRAALETALGCEAEYCGFVGSRRKFATLTEAIRQAEPAISDEEARRLSKIKAPAGLDIGAIAPDEIALSILAEIVAVRRARQRAELDSHTQNAKRKE
ncbi:XdhC family protein [Affinirhizobium pseudoryzae]|uniref:XdhC family protein n=1 Tax=Allorhizobium pseudoryzae TaxID=379684 RepID=UPI0013EC33D0|nr:XdhC/CoxI family protein [Allorhizobium pseudoryzae]